VSEELEHSLQQAIETYLNERLRTIDEQLSRLQTDVNEALAQLRDHSSPHGLDGTTLSAAIFAHLQTARGQKLSGATSAAPVPREAKTIRRAIEEIESQSSQTEILKSLLTSAARFAERVALFVIKNEQATGWRVCRASDPTNLDLIGGVSLPLSAETILNRAVRSQSSWSSDARSHSEDHLLIDQLGGEPKVVSAVPLVVRGKVVAVLYADSASSDSNAINSDALEVLARVAAMAVNLASVHRAAPEAQEESAAPAPSESTTAATAEPSPEVESTYTPEIEPQTAEALPPPVAEAESPAAAAPEIGATPPVETISEEAPREAVAAGEEQTISEAPVSEPEPSVPEATETNVVSAPPVETISEAPASEPEPSVPEATETNVPMELIAQPPTEAPAFISEYVTPLGSARRFGVSEPELPIEVSAEERRLHNDARRFARLLVSEIKLYNEPKVKEGRSNGDLYDRLREDIDRSRQMYDKRVAPPVAARHDYFHQELVNTLAEGDQAKLGSSYPGAVSAIN
jgi:hypothetical protein